MLGIETVEVVADKGSESREDIKNCVMNGIVPNVAMKYDKKERLYSIDYVEAEITEETRCSRNPDDIQIREYASIHNPLTQIPNNIKPSPKTHTFERSDYTPPKKVVLMIREDVHKLKQRMCLQEHPFRAVKWHHRVHYPLCKGNEKTSTELGISFLAA